MSYELELEKTFKEWLEMSMLVIKRDDGYYYDIYLDYNDCLHEQYVKEIIDKKDKDSRLEAFNNILSEDYEDCFSYQSLEDDFYRYCRENDLDYLIDNDDFMIMLNDLMIDNVTIDLDVKHFLKQEYRVNVLIDFNGQDGNSEFSNSSNLDNCKDNNLYTLLKKQGYTKKDYINNNGENKFLSSVKDEIENNCYDYLTTLVVLKRMTLEELINRDEIEVSKDNVIGLFNQWNGSGSLLEIALEKGFKLGNNDIYDIQVEGAKNGNHSVDEVYWLCQVSWR